MTILGPMLNMVFQKSPIKYGGMLLVESLPFPPLLPRLDFHGQTEVRIKFLRLIYMETGTYYLGDSTYYRNKHV